MSKIKLNCNKQILRYSEDNIPKHVKIQQLPEPKSTRKATKEDSKHEEIIPKDPVVTVPKINSTIGIKKRVKQVEHVKPRKVKSLTDLPKPERVTVDEKLTKKMNFPFDQKLYKELISLKLVEKPVLQPLSTNFEPVLKDRVPNLEDFFQPVEMDEYSVTVPVQMSAASVSRRYNGLSIYQVMRTWDKL
ncbi:hypothetical protein CBL_13440 [Carabus blaptoides fortunei]